MDKLTGNPRKIFKIIYERYCQNNLIDSDEIKTIFTNIDELEQDLEYLFSLGLIERDFDWNYCLTTLGRSYFKNELIDVIELLIKSVLCPIIVAFFTTLITLWLKGS